MGVKQITDDRGQRAEDRGTQIEDEKLRKIIALMPIKAQPG
jgi:hypothetical protein